MSVDRQSSGSGSYIYLASEGIQTVGWGVAIGALKDAYVRTVKEDPPAIISGPERDRVHWRVTFTLAGNLTYTEIEQVNRVAQGLIVLREEEAREKKTLSDDIGRCITVTGVGAAVVAAIFTAIKVLL